MFAAAIHPLTGVVRWVNAGHEPALVLAADGGIRARLASSGPALGLFAGVSLTVGELQLARGETLLVATDGVSEARSLAGDLFGDDRLEALVADAPRDADAANAAQPPVYQRVSTLDPLMQPSSRPLTIAAVLGAALTLSALLLAVGLTRVRPDAHFVSVKGVAEREVRADLAIWPLVISAADDDLARAQAKLEQSVAAIRAFLVRQQVDTTQLSLQSFVVTDAFANQYGGQGEVRTRYVIRQTVVVRSTDPVRVLAASQRVGELVNAGVVLTSGGDYGAGGPTFLFTGLNALKPPMIAEATARAREAAEQFARDARQDLGGIRRASQGVFEILPRDQAPGITEGSQLVKTVRVVSTIEYALR